ncbi:peroxynitrite isomerase THAP4-like isoform X3 [Carcharodon carcharias]|uniref:peroxynitrite isomerase THAP4-like isoform X2 n=1 Tax=Carcharodon carcharias TaxID=13397 RepID=UPI001B7F5BFF|nr:peroxynitrite isomerase THAP4-like isoform X2 [Carcharodon carcharias]XP_041038683.1 peroxynitrite isomerase THAP4-like isoform X3 [Carcharodon carcharias]
MLLFPMKDAKRLAKWIAAVGRTDWRPTKFSFLCSTHFTKDSFQKRQADQHHRLKFNAVPSIFHFSENQKKADGGRIYCRGAAKIQLAPVNQERTSSGFLASEVLDDETTELLKPNFVTVDSEHVLERVSVLGESCATFQSSSVAGEPVVCTVAEQQCTLKSDGSQAPVTERLLIDGTVPLPDDATPSASGACKLINSLHSYCLSPPHSMFLKDQDQVMKKNTKLKHLRQQSSRVVKRVKRLEGLICKLQETNSTLIRCFLPQDNVVHLNPAVEPLSWMLGNWISEPLGEGCYPTIKPFKYMEEVQITHVGQPMLNISFNGFNPETKKPMHRECGFIRIKPGTNKVAFISAQNTGIVEIEEGEVKDQELTLASQSVARMSFAKEPHVQQITRTFRLTEEGKLEQTVFMATNQQPLLQHLHITYRQSSLHKFM